MFIYICKMKRINIEKLEDWYSKNYQNKIDGRWITLEQILPIVNTMKTNSKVELAGLSYQNKEIYTLQFGKGKTKILIWTQMHGNESTGTKALFDLINFLNKPGDLSYLSDQILENCTIKCIPMLNPDGAKVYTRLNAQKIDLNRDFIDKKAPESKLLQEIVKDFQPEYCFNMHDQRTIFSVGKNIAPATISFLAPSEEKKRKVTKGRKETMEVIVSMNNFLQNLIPNQVGRYTDAFYPTATGDNFQKMGYKTILVESGHYTNDYQREMTRKYTFLALLQGLFFISHDKEKCNYEDYFAIPNNEKKYLDILLKDVNYQGIQTDIGILFDEILEDGKLQFIPRVDKVEDLSEYRANRIISIPNLIFQNENAIFDYLKKGS